MPRPKQKDGSEAHKNLQLRATDNTSLGKIITYIQNHPSNTQALATSTLEARFLPFVMDTDDPAFLETAIQCARSCESWAATIREYVGLAQNSTAVPASPQPTNKPNHKAGNKKKKKVLKESVANEPEIPSAGFDLMEEMGI